MKEDEKKEVRSMEFHFKRFCVLRQTELGSVRALRMTEDDDIQLPLENLVELSKQFPLRKYWIHDNEFNVNLTLFER